MKKKFILLLLFLSFLFIKILPTQASTFNNKETIKVGWYIEPGFQEYDSQGNPCGYAYEYLEKLAGYENWKITYVPASYEECLSLIKTKSIDLIFQKPDFQQTIDEYLISEKSIESMSLKFVTLKDNKRFASKDYASYNDLKVGIVRDEQIKHETLDYANKKNIHFTLIEYESFGKLMLALNEKKIDSIVLSPLQNPKNYRLLDDFSFSSLHLYTDINNVKIMDQINDGVSKIDYYQMNFKTDLFQKYYGTKQEGKLVLSKSELLYIKENPVLDVYIGPDWYPIIYQNANREKRGIFIDFLEYITDETGLQFNFIKYDNYAQVLDTQGYRLNKSISITNGNFSDTKKYNIQLSEHFFTTNILKITSHSKIEKIALPIGVSYSEEIENSFDGIEVIYFQSMSECLDAIYSKQASITYMNSYEADYYLKLPKYHDLKATIQPNQNMNFYFSTSSSCNLEAKSIIEKSFSTIAEKDWLHILNMNTSYHNENSLRSFFSRYMQYFMIGIVLCIVVLLFMTLQSIRYRRKIKELNKQKKLFDDKDYLVNHKYRELKLPIEAIIGWTQQALKWEIKNNEIEEYLRKISIVSQHTNDLLAIETAAKFKNNIFSYSEYCATYEKNFISSLLTIVQYEADKKGIQIISTIISENKNCIMMNRVKVSQALLNILYNAIKFSNRGSQIEFILNVTYNDETKKIKHVYEIIDHGVGITPSKLPNIFKLNEPLDSNDDRQLYFNSSGYGLDFSKQYIDAMGGNILVESTLGKGSIFTVILQFECAQEATLITEEKDNPYYSLLKGKRILFAEENSIEFFSCTNLLEKLGANIETVEDGQHVMERFIRSKKDYYDVLLVNLSLPVMNAYAIASEIRQLKRTDAISIPIIGISSLSTELDMRIQWEKAGLNDCIEKPIDIELLIQKIIYHISRAK